MTSFRPVLASLWFSLFDTTQRPSRYLSRALLVDLPVTFALTALIYWAIPDTVGPRFNKLPPFLLFVGLTVFSPALETLFMMVVFSIVKQLVRSMPYRAMLSALIWGGLHSLNAPTWGLVVFWPFLIFSICYLTWETRSKRHAFCMTASLHALHNFTPALALLVFGHT